MTRKNDEADGVTTASQLTRRRFVARAAGVSIGAVAAGTGSRLSKAGSRLDKGISLDSCPSVKTPMKEVVGKVAFITGGSSGIGLGIARAFAEAGMKVVIGYRSPKHIDEAMQYLRSVHNRVHKVSVDVTDRQGMERAAAESIEVFGKVHVLVNNAGVGTWGGLRKTTYDDWDWVFGVNCTGVFNGVHAFLPYLEKHGEGGHILATASVAGLFAWGGLGGYSASKFAVVGLMETLRLELAETDIGVSVCCPGSVRSDPDAARNRPSHLADVGVQLSPAELDRVRKAKQDPEVAMDPLEVGQLVLRGMQNNDLYIFTHPEYAVSIQERNDALTASIPRGVAVSEGRRQSASRTRPAIYSVERDRKRCT